MIGIGEWLADARRDSDDMMGGGCTMSIAGVATGGGGVDAARALAGESVNGGGESITRDARPRDCGTTFEGRGGVVVVTGVLETLASMDDDNDDADGLF